MSLASVKKKSACSCFTRFHEDGYAQHGHHFAFERSHCHQVVVFHFRNSQVVMYLDNDGARAGLIKMRGATDIGGIVIQDAALLEAQNSFRSWFGRVPTSSNVADGPNRCDCRSVESHGSIQDVFQWEDISATWCEV